MCMTNDRTETNACLCWPDYLALPFLNGPCGPYIGSCLWICQCSYDIGDDDSGGGHNGSDKS